MPEAETDFDAVVIGAGVIGAAITLELSRAGRSVLCVDKAEAAGSGSTSNSCAIVRFSYSTRAGVNLAWEGLHYWRDWPNHIGISDERGLAEYRQCGQAILITENTDHPARVRRVWDELDIPYEEWSVEELRRRMPIIDDGVFGPPKRPDDPDFWNEADGVVHGALNQPDAGYVNDPQLSAYNLQLAAETAGATFRFRTEVSAIPSAGNRVTGVVFDDGSQVFAPVVVNVAGPHSYLLNQIAGVYDSMRVKTCALRHEVHHVPSPAGFDFEANGFSLADDDTGVYYRPEVGNHILIGSADPACDEKQWVHPDAFDPTITQDQWDAQVLRAARRFPELGKPHAKRGVVDLYDVSDDWLPIYDRTDLDGFYVAIGTSGNQYKNAGVVGFAMAQLIDAVEAGHDHDVDPFVVAGHYTGRPLELGSFSRNREAATTSMSVHG